MKQSIHAKRMARRHRRNKAGPKLNLVSLMDIFTILVFFLLVNSSDVEVLQTNKDIELPQSIAEAQPPSNLILMVSAESIIVGGRQVVDLVSTKSLQRSKIPELQKELEYRAKRKPYRTPEEAAKGRGITIMADKGTPYTLIKKIMSTAASTDYRRISLAVNQVPDANAEGLVAPTGEGAQ